MTNHQHENAATLHVIRDLIMLALDAIDSPDITERNRFEARSALAEAKILIEGARHECRRTEALRSRSHSGPVRNTVRESIKGDTDATTTKLEAWLR